MIQARAEELGSPAYALTENMYQRIRTDKNGIRFRFGCGGEETELQISSIAEYQMMNASLAFFTMKKLSKLQTRDLVYADLRNPGGSLALPHGNGYGRGHH